MGPARSIIRATVVVSLTLSSLVALLLVMLAPEVANARSLQGEGVTSTEDNLWDYYAVRDTWTEIIQGNPDIEGGCRISYSFALRADQVVPIVGMLKAVDSITCRAELQFGISTNVSQLRGGSGGSVQSEETSAGDLTENSCSNDVVHSTSQHDDIDWEIDCGEATHTPSPAPSEQSGTATTTQATIVPTVILTLPPDVPSELSPTPSLIPEASPVAEEINKYASVGQGRSRSSDPGNSHLNRRLMYSVWYQDPIGIDVSGVEAAVRSNTSGSEIVGAACLHQRYKYDPTGWRLSTTNPRFNSWDCLYQYNAAVSIVGAHHYNNDFPACLGQTVHLYYEDVAAWVFNDPSYQYGYATNFTGIWKSGAENTCNVMIRGFIQSILPEEYFYYW